MTLKQYRDQDYEGIEAAMTAAGWIEPHAGGPSPARARPIVVVTAYKQTAKGMYLRRREFTGIPTPEDVVETFNGSFGAPNPAFALTEEEAG